MSHDKLLRDIISLDKGYVTIRSGGWDVAFAARNAKGYINIKVKAEGYEKFVTLGYLDVASRKARTNPWCEIRDRTKLDDVMSVIEQVLSGSASFSDAPNPRGKPPGAKRSGGYKRSGYQPPRSETPPREDIPPSGDIAGMVAALQAERDNLAYKVAALEKQVADAYQRGKQDASPSDFRSTDNSVVLDGKAAKVWRQAVGEYKAGNAKASINMLEVVMRLAFDAQG